MSLEKECVCVTLLPVINQTRCSIGGKPYPIPLLGLIGAMIYETNKSVAVSL